MKECFKCKIIKPLDHFYAHPQMGDGHLNKCKACTRADVKERERLNPEKIKAYEKIRNASASRKINKRRYSLEHTARYPQKRAARVAVGNALRDGYLVKLPCFKCGDKKSEAHHEDYSKPLDVIWLCHMHHREHHGTLMDRT